MTTPRQSKGGFTVFNFYVEVHARFTGVRVDVNSSKGKLKFNSHIHRVKSAYEFNSTDVKALILFMYLHNPLGYSELKQYGSLTAIWASAPYFKTWKNNIGSVSGKSLLELVQDTAPNTDSSVHELSNLMNEIYNSMSKGITR